MCQICALILLLYLCLGFKVSLLSSLPSLSLVLASLFYLYFWWDYACDPVGGRDVGECGRRLRYDSKVVSMLKLLSPFLPSYNRTSTFDSCNCRDVDVFSEELHIVEVTLCLFDNSIKNRAFGFDFYVFVHIGLIYERQNVGSFHRWARL
jgi:hypothetical protein